MDTTGSVGRTVYWPETVLSMSAANGGALMATGRCTASGFGTAGRGIGAALEIAGADKTGRGGYDFLKKRPKKARKKHYFRNNK